MFRRMMTRGPLGLAALLLVQSLCSAVFIADILSSVIGFRETPISWQFRELIELAAAFGLLAGIGLGAWALWLAMSERNAAEQRLRRASGLFADVLLERFTEWRLTAAERDVALLAIKGLSTADIAALRKTSEGTVKAQTAAIYRKAGVTGRPQLLSLFIEDLFDPALIARPVASDEVPAPVAVAER
ncbi:helix-turn-helix transcriptional regulator [Paracoccus sp. (in: a-proteobacteria)]|uniref:helix-turn-helix transcriptional regulator n=1 Tax=Paracoccus sp. TaxID=267 RepID=UPI003A85DA7C